MPCYYFLSRLPFSFYWQLPWSNLACVQDSNLQLLLSVTQAGEGQWAWARLGLQYSRLGDTSAAINCLCSALKADPRNRYASISSFTKSL